MKFCYKCGAQYPKDNTPFCPECGEAAPSQSSVSSDKGSDTSTVSSSASGGASGGRGVAFWLAWTLVALLAAGNIFQGLYFGAFADGDETSADDKVVSAGATTTTQGSSATSSDTGDTLSGQAAIAADSVARTLLRNAMMAIDVAYIDFRSYDSSLMTPEVLADIEPSIDFILVADETEVASSPTARAALDEVDYSGRDQVCVLGSRSSSGKTFAAVTDRSAGGLEHYFYVDGELVDSW